MTKEICDRMNYFYRQTDGTMIFPSSAEGDLLKMVNALLMPNMPVRLEEGKLQTCLAFNSLRTKEKWSQWKSQSGQWCCKHCKAILTDGPNRASPFHGCIVYCGECGGELTRRTGGGMCDPFEWELVPNNNFCIKYYTKANKN